MIQEEESKEETSGEKACGICRVVREGQGWICLADVEGSGKLVLAVMVRR